MTNDAMSLGDAPPLGEAWAALRAKRPLVHNITNFVVMNFTANVLLALGASPVMAHAVEEVEDFAGMAQSLVINIGTLDASFVAAMHLAAARAGKQNVPWILDPVGAGATRYRTDTAQALIARGPAVIRGNGGEILALAGEVDAGASKGVDSLADSDSALEAARRLAARTGAVVAVTGARDFVVTADRVETVDGGHVMSQQVTGTGCAATAAIGAFLGVAPPFEAAVHGLTAMKRAAAAAASKAEGPGSFAVQLIDAIAADRG